MLENQNVLVRPADYEELARINEIRRYVNDVHVEEFGVDPAFHRKGVATALVEYMKRDAAQRGYPRIELDMWEFNQGALAFYENVGFQTYRRYMELWVK